MGSVCRAMKTMGLSRLVLAGCPEYEESRVRNDGRPRPSTSSSRRSASPPRVGARGLLPLGGFTRRRGERRKAFSLSVADFAALALERKMGAGTAGAVALVFGNERTGLTEEEIKLCSLAVHIPTSDAFPPSISRRRCRSPATSSGGRTSASGDGSATPVTRAEVEPSVARIAEHLRGIGFFKITRDRDLSAFLRDTAERAGYTPTELRYFESIFRKAAGMIYEKGKEKGEPAP